MLRRLGLSVEGDSLDDLAAQQEAKQSSSEQESKRATPGQQSEQRLGLVGAWLSRELAPLERERQTIYVARV